MWRSARPTPEEALEDVELVNRLTAGDTDLFPLFYRRHGQAIAHCIRGAIRPNTRLETEDLLQDFFVKLQDTGFRDINRWNRITPLPTFLRRIVRNFVVDRYRADPTSPGRPSRSPSMEDAAPRSSLAGLLRSWSSGARSAARPRLLLEPLERDDRPEFESDLPGPAAALESRQLRRRGLEAWARLTSDRDKRLICVKFHRETPADQAAAREGLLPGAYRKAAFDAQKRHLIHLRSLAPEFFS